MDRFSTKDTYERETEETERLVRDSPKVKPPRHDRRRETIESEKDPDLDQEDKDLSKNYKVIGGSSMALRVVAKAKGDLISVRLKEDPTKVVQVTEDTLRTQPSKYEALKEDESEGKSKPETADLEAKNALREMAKGDEGLAAVLKDFTNPDKDVFHLAKDAPKMAVKQFLRGRTPPKGIETLGDLQRVLLLKDEPPPKAKKPGRGKAPQEPGAPPETPAVGQEPKAEPEAKPKAEPEAKPEEKPKPEAKSKPKAQEPKGRPVSRTEREAATHQIIMTFPPSVAADLLLSKIHPDDVQALVADYNVAKALPAKLSSIETLREKAPKYVTDPSKVGPPKTGVDANGETKSFDELEPAEQSRELKKHQIRTVAMSLAARDVITRSLTEEAGAPERLADSLADFILSSRGASENERVELATRKAEALFDHGLEDAPEKITPSAVQRILKASKDPATQRLAVGYLQAQDYQAARARYLDSSSDEHISEHQAPDMIASRLLKATDFLRSRTKLYPEGSVAQDTALAFRNRVMRQLGALAPEKVASIQERLDVADNRHYDEALRRHQRAVDRARAEGKAEPPSPVKPPRYDVQRKSAEELEAEAADMWKAFQHRSASRSNPVFARVVARYQAGPFSIYPDTSAMRHERTAVYWGAGPRQPGHEGFESYRGWEQAQARDLTNQDYGRLLTAAKEWLTTPVLSVAIDGIVRDTQLRAALDLAIRTAADGRYSSGLHPTVYNHLLAKLAGVSEDETLLTVKTAVGVNFAVGSIRPGSRIKADGDTLVVKTAPASDWVVAQNQKDNLVVCHLNPHSNKWEGLEWFGSDKMKEAVAALDRRMQKSKTARDSKMMPKFAKTDAEQILTRLDRLASTIQERHAQWGMPFETAKAMVNDLDRTADEVEVAAFGKQSFERRQMECVAKTAEVIQRDPDEGYMDTFQNPMAPIQTEADEPYMGAYGPPDQSSAVHHGESTTGRPLAP